VCPAFTLRVHAGLIVVGGRLAAFGRGTASGTEYSRCA
jgi:hypothetical protein